MKIQEINIDSLIPYEFNNKKHDENQVNRIANSIKEFWFKNPLVIDKNNIIVNWHWRRLWAKKLWLKTVPCIVADDLTDEQIKKFRILDNRLNESERDLENLQLELSWMSDFNFWDLEIDINQEFGDLIPELNDSINPDDFWEDFSLPSWEKWDLEQMTFTLTSEQLEQVKEALESAKKSEDMIQAKAMWNENSNWNALYVIAMKWTALN